MRLPARRYSFRWQRHHAAQILTFWAEQLHITPEVKCPEPTVDQFYRLRSAVGQIDGSVSAIPRLNGLSGASIWSYVTPGASLLWDRSTVLRIMGVQSTARHNEWFRGVDWVAARRRRRHGQDIPVGSSRSAFPNGHSAMAIAARLADPECPWREAAG